MNKLKKCGHFGKNKMAAIRGHFRRGTDPYFFLFCYQLAMYRVSCFYHKMHDSSQNCYISAPLLGVSRIQRVKKRLGKG